MQEKGQPLGISLDDLAFDCIADLFRRDKTGAFVKLKRYFDGMDVAQMTDEDLLAACRRLVFSKVNQDLYRQYAEMDPDLHRIIRNIKDALPRVPFVRLTELHGEYWLAFGNADAGLPMMAPEILEAHLTGFVRPGMTFHALLKGTAVVFGDQDLYRRAFPLTGYALLLRASFGNLSASESPSSGADDGLSSADLERFVGESVDRIAARMKTQYVREGSVSGETFAQYLQAVGSILCDEYVHPGRAERSYMEHLSAAMTGLTPEAYKTNHRARLEYLARLARRDFLKRIQNEL